MGEVTAFSKPGADLLGNRRFESISLQRGVKRTPESRLATSEYDTGVDQGSRGWLSAVGSGAPSSARGPLSCCRCQMSRQPCRSRSTLMVTRVRCARRSTAWRLAASCSFCLFGAIAFGTLKAVANGFMADNCNSRGGLPRSCDQRDVLALQNASLRSDRPRWSPACRRSP
jgi:hypothetical protein